MGFHSSDDAAVTLLRPDLAIVQSLDFFMPIVDDPYTFGMIAAANSISDIYAMGATPTNALSILGIPVKKLPLEVANEIMKGGAEICRRAGIPILGGHSIDDTEPKFGLSVTGVVHPDEIWRNNAVKDGDLLILTKPIGVGVFGSANKKELLNNQQYATFVETTTFLNDVPMQVGKELGIEAATDVTGFGLLGHAWEMVSSVGMSVELWVDRLPVIRGVRELLEAGVKPGATRRNIDFVRPYLNLGQGITPMDLDLLGDPQTSGGLLMAVSPDKVEDFVQRLHERGALAAAVVGRCSLEDTSKIAIEKSPAV
jgi:selenide,water dikinase